ncbi:hypothetical protein DSO57_1037963 [Entomophthora muscae]|uniref:Uncharacterized protein n=1 Tax=Entomophthora muscae TaxID=34485 RepID=A0ACC2RDI7_9FUNG|nr:hypothetical protein DSO57_1037963 [Entomophthora muscae]
MGNLDVMNHVTALGVLCSSQQEDFLISGSSPSVLRSNGPNFPVNPFSPTTSSVQIFEPPSSDFEDLGLSGDESEYYGLSNELLSRFKHLSEASSNPSRKRLPKTGFPVGYKLGHHQGRRAIIAVKSSSIAPNKKKRLEISTTRKPLKKAKNTSLKTFEVDSLSNFTAKEQPLEFSAVAASSENVENEYEVFIFGLPF